MTVNTGEQGRLEALRRLAMLFDGVPIGQLVIGSDGMCQSANPAIAAMLGTTVDALRDRHFLDHTAPEEHDDEIRIAERLWRGDTPVVVREVRYLRADGSVELVIATSSLVRGAENEAHAILTQVEAIGDRRKAEVELREAQSALDGIVTIDASQRVVSWNEGAERLLGHGRHAAIGKHITFIVPPAERGGHIAGFTRLAEGGEPHMLGKTVPVDALHADGHLVPIELSLSRWFRGRDPYFTAVLRDITDRRIAEAEEQWRATHDLTTGLSNLNALRQQAPLLLAVAAARELPVAMVSLDVAGLGSVIGALGSVHAEELLGQVGSAMRGLGSPTIEVYYLGGSLFVALVTLEGPDPDGMTFDQRLARLGKVMLDAATGPFVIDELPVELEGRAGVAAGDPAVTDAEELLRRAEAARGSSPRRVTVARMTRSDGLTRDDLLLLGSLRGAIAGGELELHYQPLVRNPGLADTPGPTKVEVLVRWRHPQRGLLAPTAFIGLVEQTPLITTLTTWVLGEALRQQQRWAAQGLDVRVAINLSPNVLANNDVPAMVTEQLTETGAPADRLTLEITESALVADPDAASATVSALRSTGVVVSLDDFGTGYTSLGLLRSLDLDEVKLDQTFVRNATSNSADAAIVATVVDLAHRLGLQAVAEGVEDTTTRDLLFSLGYDLLQGYLFSQPLPADAATEWLETHAVPRLVAQ
jgi:PAS domain S-box-containing protein